MPQFQTLMEVLKILPKTNCRQCDEKTCMAFSAAVFKGEKRAQVIPVLVESARYLGIALLILPAAALVETFITPLLLGLV